MSIHERLFSHITLSFLLTLSWIGLAKSAEIKPFSNLGVHFVSQTVEMNFADAVSSSWQLIRYQTSQGVVSLPYSQHEPTLTFQEGRISGTTGCNRYVGSYKLEQDTLSIETPAATLMACGFEGLSQQQQDYLKALTEITRYELKDNELVLFNAQNEPLLVFQRILPASLTGNLWQLQQYNNGRGAIVSLLEGTEINLRLSDRGEVDGFAGCNRYRGQWRNSEGQFLLSPPISTKKFCNQPEGIMKQETDYLALFEKVSDYEIDGKTLVLKDKTGRKLAQFQAIIALQE